MPVTFTGGGWTGEVRLGRKVVATLDGCHKQQASLTFRVTSRDIYWSDYPPFCDGRYTRSAGETVACFVMQIGTARVVYDLRTIDLAAGTATLVLPPRKETA